MHVASTHTVTVSSVYQFAAHITYSSTADRYGGLYLQMLLNGGEKSECGGVCLELFKYVTTIYSQIKYGTGCIL